MAMTLTTSLTPTQNVLHYEDSAESTAIQVTATELNTSDPKVRAYQLRYREVDPSTQQIVMRDGEPNLLMEERITLTLSPTSSQNPAADIKARIDSQIDAAACILSCQATDLDFSSLG